MKTVNTKAICAAALLAASVAVSPVLADDTAAAYTMTVIRDAAHGSRIIKGDYDKAIERITRAEFRYAGNFAGETNLCVAYTKSGELEKAETACNAAVDVANGMLRVKADLLADYTRKAYMTDLAIALSNRGVVYAAMGNTELAEQDFRKADDLGSSLSAPAINLARLAS